MWRCIPAVVVIGCLLYYDIKHPGSKLYRLLLYAFCTMLLLLCARALLRYS
jgi:hypothetical protein